MPAGYVTAHPGQQAGDPEDSFGWVIEFIDASLRGVRM